MTDAHPKSPLEKQFHFPELKYNHKALLLNDQAFASFVLGFLDINWQPIRLEPRG